MTDEQFAIIAGLLSEIRDVLVGPVADDPLPCVHEHKVDRSKYRWVCRDCGYEEDYVRP